MEGAGGPARLWQWSPVRAKRAGPRAWPGVWGWNAEKGMHLRDTYLVKFLRHGDWLDLGDEREFSNDGSWFQVCIFNSESNLQPTDSPSFLKSLFMQCFWARGRTRDLARALTKAGYPAVWSEQSEIPVLLPDSIN